MVDSTGSGLASVIFGAATNNADYTIKAGHHVTFDWDTYGLANGIGLVVEAGAILDFKADIVTYLKPKANIDINGAFYVANRATVSDFTATEGRENVYQAARTVKTYSVEETLGTGYLVAWNKVMEAAIITENARLRGLDENEMMADEVISFIETTRASLTLSDYLDYVDENPGSFYHDVDNNLLYIHTSDSTNPSTKTITGIEPINRPTAGNENRCTIMFNSTGVFTNTAGGTPIIQAYGWHPEREWTQLSANVNISATELSALNHSLDIQQGDKVSIGSGNENGMTVEAGKGLYSVSNYVSETKITTLSAGVRTARLQNDYVTIFSRPIKISRSSGTTAIFSATTYFNDVVLIGVNVNGMRLTGPTVYTNFNRRFKVRHSTLYKGTSNQQLAQSEFFDTFFCGDAGAYSKQFGTGCFDNTLDRCIGMNNDAIALYSNKTEIKNSVCQNDIEPATCYIYNSQIMNVGLPADLADREINKLMKNCVISGASQGSPINMGSIYAVDCVFKDNTTGYMKNTYGTLHNCLFEGATEFVDITTEETRRVNEIIESFDHNQIPSNYKAGMRGGTIETLFTDEVVQPGHLIFKPASSVYPVFRDYPIYLIENRIASYHISMLKDFTGGTVKAEIIDPANDPIIDTNAVALETELFPDIADDKQSVTISYKPTESKQYILRVSVINSSGTVNLDPIVTFERFRRKELK